MADVGYQKPTNAIVVDGGNMHVQTMKVENASNMYAGRAVMKGTNDDDAVVNTAEGTAIGWLGYEQTHKKHRPATVDTIYLINAQAAVLHGPGMVLVASIAPDETIIKGDMLVATSAGQLIKRSATETPIAIAEESLSVATSASTDLMVRSLI